MTLDDGRCFGGRNGRSAAPLDLNNRVVDIGLGNVIYPQLGWWLGDTQ